MASNSKAPGLLLRNAGIFNPVLVQAVGLCPVVAMATSVRNAALLAAVSAVIITLSELIASLFLKPIPRWIRIGIYIILGGAVVAPLMILIERSNAPLFGELGIYLPIMAVNSLNVLRCERFAVKIPPLSALLDGLTASVGYSLVLLFVGLVREILGSGSIFGFEFFEGRTFNGLLLPFGGFLVIGFAGAALRALIAKFWPKYLDKKQPKPGSKKKTDRRPEIKTAPVVDVPEFTADENPFTLEEISAEPATADEQETYIPTPVQPEPKPVSEPEPVAVSEPAEAPVEAAPAEPVVVEQPEETQTIEEQSAEQEAQAEEPVEEPVTEPVEEEPVQDTEPEQKPTYKELTLDDIDSAPATPKKPAEKTDFADFDDELEALMSRSISDVLVKPKKEDDEE